MPLRVLSASAPGHEGNIFRAYVYVCARDAPANRGWVPTALLHQAGRCGAGAVTWGLKQKKWNELAVRIVGTRRERYVVEHAAGGRIAVKPESLIVVDSESDLWHMSQRQFMLKVHPDKGNRDVQLFHLGRLMRRQAPPGGAGQ